jgi:hypothetical protein
MYDVYLNGRNDLLIVPRGYAIPSDVSGNWRKKKRLVRSVSEEIRKDVQAQGFHRRSLVGHRSKIAANGATISQLCSEIVTVPDPSARD